MPEIGIRELKNRTSEVLRAVREERAEYVITYRGKPVARLVPVVEKGDAERALQELERLSQEVDDPDVRLELAKLYEHHVREPLKALEQVDQGTGESPEAWAHRRERLRRKLDKKQG